MPSMYEVLGLPRGADPGQVKAAFHALAKSSHPDVNAGDPKTAERFRDITAAYEILSDPKKRAAYDLGLKHKQAEAHRRVWKAIATTAAAFVVTVGCGLYFLPSALSAHEPKGTIVAGGMASPSPMRESVSATQGFFTLAAKVGSKLSMRVLARTDDPVRLDKAITQ